MRIYLEDGRYAVTDDEGKYHFEGVTPGSHVVQLDTITLPEELEPLRCDTRVRSAGNATVAVRRPARRRARHGRLRRRAARRADRRRAPLADDGSRRPRASSTRPRSPRAPCRCAKRRCSCCCPRRSRTCPAAPRATASPMADPAAQSGSLRFTLGDVAADGAPQRDVRDARRRRSRRRAPGAGAAALHDGARPRRAHGRPSSNVVQRGESVVERISYTFSPRYNAYSFAPQFGSMQTAVDPRDGAELDRIAAEWRGMRELTIRVIGHADRTPISARNRGALPRQLRVVGRARASRRRLPAHRAARGAHRDRRPRRRRADRRRATTPDALARNRRVEIEVEGVRSVAAAEWRSRRGERGVGGRRRRSGALGGDDGRAAARARFGAAARHRGGARARDRRRDARAAARDLAAERGLRAARADGARRDRALARASRFGSPSNGRPVSELNFDGTEPNAAKTAALSRWRGVDLVAGDNRLVATVVDAAGDGDRRARAHRALRRRRRARGARRRGVAAHGRRPHAAASSRCASSTRPASPRGPARSAPIASIRRTAPGGKSRRCTTTRCSSRAAASRRSPSRRTASCASCSSRRRRPAPPSCACASTSARSRRSARGSSPSSATGSSSASPKRTTAYTDLEAALEPPDIEDGYSSDGRLAFFAKGRIKGSTLLTIAFDSERDRPLVEDRLFGTIEPDRYYTLYGDAVEQRFEAATTRKLYLKIERRQFAALFGDFETGLHDHGARPLQPQPHGLQGRLRRRASSPSTRSRPRTASATAATSSRATARRGRIASRARRSSRTAIA